MTRLIFVVLFAAMSLMHGPVMAFSGEHHISEHHAGMIHEGPGHHRGLHDHGGPTQPDEHKSCNGFACFMAVEPELVDARPLHAMMIGILRFDPASKPHPASTRPNVPPPRLQS